MVISRRSALLFALALACAGPVRADDDEERREAERARRRTSSGELLPLAALARIALARYPGKLLEAELDEDDGRVTYELRILQASGRVVEVEIDARTGRIVDGDD